MARPTKVSLDYFACDVRILDDPKVALVMFEHGPIVAAVVLRLLGEIYGREGYWMPWDEESALLFAMNTCHGTVTVDQAQAIVASLTKRGFFDGPTLERTGKLTSHGIQARWAMTMRAAHRQAEIDPDIDLLKDEEKVSSEDFAKTSETFANNSEDFAKTSDNFAAKKRKEKKSNYITNQQTHACARTREDAGVTPAPPDDPVRAEIVRFFVKPNDFSVDRDLIDRTVAAVRDGVPGLGPKDLQRISKKADAEVARYERTDGRSGKQYRWMTIADEIHARFKAAGRPWDEDFAGENEPPPRPRSAPMPASVPEAETEPTVDELLASLLDKTTDPAKETLEQTARRLKCTQEIAFSERATWRRLKQMQVLT